MMPKWLFAACVTAIIFLVFEAVWSTGSIDSLRAVCIAQTAMMGLAILASVDIEGPEEGDRE